VLIVAACDRGALNTTVPDAAAGADGSTADLATPAPCPGYSEQGPPGACSHAGSGWLGSFCYPDTLTYCACVAGLWSCCGDLPPSCPPDPPNDGDHCCPGPDTPTPLTCSFSGDAGLAEHCTCGIDLTWHCTAM
jgi:hypothetical protein